MLEGESRFLAIFRVGVPFTNDFLFLSILKVTVSLSPLRSSKTFCRSSLAIFWGSEVAAKPTQTPCFLQYYPNLGGGDNIQEFYFFHLHLYHSLRIVDEIKNVACYLCFFILFLSFFACLYMHQCSYSLVAFLETWNLDII